MIQASELRIGSLVYNPQNELCKIAEISGITETVRAYNLDFWQDKVAFGYSCNEISGIPLTEELLLKMGFEKNVETDTWFLHIKQPISKHDFSLIQVSLLVTNDTYFDVYIDNNFIMICEFVHDLQNIVWLLGKKELALS